jgi:hypothetical protein
MRRRDTFLAAIGGAAAMLGLGGRAQSSPRPPRSGDNVTASLRYYDHVERELVSLHERGTNSVRQLAMRPGDHWHQASGFGGEAPSGTRLDIIYEKGS